MSTIVEQSQQAVARIEKAILVFKLKKTQEVVRRQADASGGSAATNAEQMKDIAEKVKKGQKVKNVVFLKVQFNPATLRVQGSAPDDSFGLKPKDMSANKYDDSKEGKTEHKHEDRVDIYLNVDLFFDEASADTSFILDAGMNNLIKSKWISDTLGPEAEIKRSKDQGKVRTVCEGMLGAVQLSSNNGIIEKTMFVWGSMKYEGILMNCSIDYSMFNPDGEPVRAKVSMRMVLDVVPGEEINKDFSRDTRTLGQFEGAYRKLLGLEYQEVKPDVAEVKVERKAPEPVADKQYNDPKLGKNAQMEIKDARIEQKEKAAPVKKELYDERVKEEELKAQREEQELKDEALHQSLMSNREYQELEWKKAELQAENRELQREIDFDISNPEKSRPAKGEEFEVLDGVKQRTVRKKLPEEMGFVNKETLNRVKEENNADIKAIEERQKQIRGKYDDSQEKIAELDRQIEESQKRQKELNDEIDRIDREGDEKVKEITDTYNRNQELYHKNHRRKWGPYDIVDMDDEAYKQMRETGKGDSGMENYNARIKARDKKIYEKYGIDPDDPNAQQKLAEIRAKEADEAKKREQEEKKRQRELEKEQAARKREKKAKKEAQKEAKKEAQKETKKEASKESKPQNKKSGKRRK